MQRRDEIILKKIINEIDVGIELIGSDKMEEFLESEIKKRAVAMTVINIGELVKSVTDEMRLNHKEIPWKAAAGMRDVTAHKYQTLRMEDVYNTVIIDFPKLKQMLKEILEEENRPVV